MAGGPVGRVAAAAVAANTRRGGDLRVTLSPRTVGSTSGFGGVLALGPGEYVTEHYHPYSEEFLHVVAGELEMALDGEPVALTAGDSLFVPIGVRHRLRNAGGTEARVVFHLSPLAPRPELGHVDTETPLDAAVPNPAVGGA
ncbi:cupin domain-containing protein [Dactylosporangium fulvum]|uniref:Cupin domain-containing protein n=1 Tax=Dactylosporangium fulvum TaxID=53359 RepID=A0ABY5WDR8_9ACTN|nr:cupin domain-containing protein [Dactylosporangium fulvum]UWP87464.1 cupin domain-containing protein [Dactylosporangium fulvum]